MARHSPARARRRRRRSGLPRWALAAIGIPLALLTAVAVLVAKPRAPEYAATVCWGLFGIAMKNGADLPGVTALAVAGILSLAVVAWAGRRRVDAAWPV